MIKSRENFSAHLGRQYNATYKFLAELVTYFLRYQYFSVLKGWWKRLRLFPDTSLLQHEYAYNSHITRLQTSDPLSAEFRVCAIRDSVQISADNVGICKKCLEKQLRGKHSEHAHSSSWPLKDRMRMRHRSAVVRCAVYYACNIHRHCAGNCNVLSEKWHVSLQPNSPLSSPFCKQLKRKLMSITHSFWNFIHSFDKN